MARRLVECYVLERSQKLSISWIYKSDSIDWAKLSELYKIAPLGEKKPENLETAFTNSMFKCFLLDGENIVGVGRALADGIDCSYICDVAVHPDYQGLGVGKNIIEKLVSLSQGHNKIILYANPGKELFYKKIGFKRMNTAMAMFKDQDFAISAGLVSEA